MAFSDRQVRGLAEVDAAVPASSEFHQRIWSYAEPVWREYRSAQTYVELLRDEGFEVEAGSGGMPTAFHATWGDGGPAIGLYAEYDATPGYSQAPVPYRQPREGLHPWAPGWTDAHSALGTAALTGALALKRTLEATGGGGRVHLFGEPAEKVCGSKPVHALRGYYDALDAAIAYHPGMHNTAYADIQSCLYWSVVFTFQCPEDEPWTSAAPGEATTSHNSVRSPGSVDALGLMLTSVKYAKENMFPRTGLWSLNETILGAGNATADNLPARITQVQYCWRSPSLEIQTQVLEILKRNARHVAGLTNCEVRMRWVTATRPGLKNAVMTETTYENVVGVGPQQLPDPVYAFARELESNLGFEPSEDPFVGGIYTTQSPGERDAVLREMLPPWQDCTGTDDYTEYTWHTPTVRVNTAKPFLRVTGGDQTHWANNAFNGLAQAIDPTWTYAAKVIVTTALDLVDEPQRLRAAREEFDRNFDAARPEFKQSLLPADFTAPIELPWPEYHETARGHEWTLPTTDQFGDLLKEI